MAHCSFPNAVRVTHVMDGTIHIGKRATMQYAETHFHGDADGVEVRPVMRVRVDDGGTLRSEFKLIIGAVGILQLDYKADVQRDAVCEFDAKVYGKKNDKIRVKESLFLNGENARGLAKSRQAVEQPHRNCGQRPGYNQPSRRARRECSPVGLSFQF
jgi:uncharacterized protein